MWVGWGGGIRIFGKYLDLRNGTRYAHCYYGTLIVSHRRPIDPRQFRWSSSSDLERRNARDPTFRTYALPRFDQMWYGNRFEERRVCKGSDTPPSQGACPLCSLVWEFPSTYTYTPQVWTRFWVIVISNNKNKAIFIQMSIATYCTVYTRVIKKLK